MTMNPEPPAATFGQPGPPPPGAATQPPGWSVTAIAGFVLSLIGCLVLTGIVGLILGIVGIVQTGGRRRRGRGLAIAAIPISIVMTVLGCYAMMGFYSVAVKSMKRVSSVLVLLRSSPDDTTLNEVVENHFSQSFRDAVSQEKLHSWLDSVRQKNGSLVGEPQNMQPVPGGNTLTIKFDGKFVNGTAPIIIRFAQTGPLDLVVDDIEVDGQSPRQ